LNDHFILFILLVAFVFIFVYSVYLAKQRAYAKKNSTDGSTFPRLLRLITDYAPNNGSEYSRRVNGTEPNGFAVVTAVFLTASVRCSSQHPERAASNMTVRTTDTAFLNVVFIHFPFKLVVTFAISVRFSTTDAPKSFSSQKN